jgi:Leucine-rich repeat (LRR) protein
MKKSQSQIFKDLKKKDNSWRDPPKKEGDFSRLSRGYTEEKGNITILGLTACNLSYLPESIGELINLKKLYLNKSRLKTLPKSIGNLTLLEILDLEQNEIYILPEEIGLCENLKEIYLQKSSLTALPESFGNLRLIEKAIFRDNKLKNLPKSFKNLQNLQELDLNSCPLETFPEEILELKSLKILKLVNTKLKVIPEAIEKLTELETLILSNNQIKELPDSICNLKKLTLLDLGNNKNLTKLPDSIGNLESLKSLTLTNNKLSSFPDSFTELQELGGLSIENNFFVEFPKEITKITNLSLIRLGQNQLSSLPESFCNLTKLNFISLSDNNWKDEWKDIVNLDVAGIMNLCRKLNGITIFISHAWNDQSIYKIIDLKDYLENNIIEQKVTFNLNIINDVIICEEDVVEDIRKFMTENVPKSQLLIFIATENSLTSEACMYELFLAKKFGIDILPVKGSSISWEDLSKIDLSKYNWGFLDLSNPTNKFEYDCENFEDICQKLSSFIKLNENSIKKTVDLSEELNKIQKSFLDLFISTKFVNTLKSKYQDYYQIFEEQNQRNISNFEFILKIARILNYEL